jgi:hypothetical protein
LYGLQVGGTGPTELHYIDSAGNVTQITDVGTVSGGGGGGTLDAAYDYGGAHLGRQVNVDSGFPVQLTAASSAVTALEVTGAIAPSHNEVVLGNGTHSSIGANAILVGSGTQAGDNAVSVGFSGNASGVSAVAVGAQTTASHTASVSIGRGAASSATNQASIGSTTYYVTEFIVGGGNTDGNERTLLVRPSNATGTDVAGWQLNLQGGRGTGAGPGGPVYLQTSVPGTTGTTIRDAENMIGVNPSTDGPVPHGEAQIACNVETQPMRFSQGQLDVSTSTGSSIDIVDLGQYLSDNKSRIGWIAVQFTLLAQGNTDTDTIHIMNTFSLNSTGVLNIGSTDTISLVDTAGALTSCLITASGTTLQVTWTATSDDFSLVWSAQWHYGPGVTS